MSIAKITTSLIGGTIGRVELNPPVGAVIPFKLWVHTHPSNTAYWSITDRNTLEVAKGILDKALVLGDNGLLSTTLQPISSSFDDTVYPNLQWTEEEVIGWLEYNSDNLGSDFVEEIYSPEFRAKWIRRRILTDDFDSDGKDW